MKEPRRQEPERTCVGCRKVAPQTALMRVVLNDGVAVVGDVGARRAPGRGAWVHRTRACLHNAARGGLARSFRRPVDASDLLSRIGQLSDPRSVDSPLATTAQKS